jgi:hypothetical protein
MLALTAGVSSIVGAVLHLRRRHAAGLRDMVRLLYLREIVPLLEEKQEKDKEGEAPAPDFELMSLDADTTVLHAREKLTGTANPPQAKRKRPELLKDKVDEHTYRAEFIFDMTFMPLPGVVQQMAGNNGAHDYWLRKLRSAEKLVGLPWYKSPLHLVRQARYWITLRYSLHALKDEEFLERLASSDVGKDLGALGAWEQRQLAGWDELAAHLLRKFQVLGGASSETFARHSRSWCVAVGFVLAFALNVDSLDLLNSYLTDPGLRQQVIAQRNAIETAAAGGSADAGPTAALPAARAELQSASAQLEQTTKGLRETLERISKTVAAVDGERSAAARADLDELTRLVAGVETEVRNVGQEVSDTDRAIRGVTHSLAASFPIGWKRFPNCTADSPDLRCAGRQPVAVAADAMPWTRWATILAAAQRADQEGFNQWIVGVLLTGLLLGLGTPFWVHAVSTAFSLRRWDPKKTPDADTAGGARAATESTGAARNNAAAT